MHRTKEQLRNQSVSSVYKLQAKPKPVEEKPKPKKVLPEDEKKPSKPPKPENSVEEPCHLNTTVENETPNNSKQTDLVEKMDVDEEKKEIPAINDEPVKIEEKPAIIEREIETNIIHSDKSEEEESGSFNINEVEYVSAALL